MPKEIFVSIYDDTPLIPEVIANKIVCELAHLAWHQGGIRLREPWAAESYLAERAEYLYRHNPRFRNQMLCKVGERARDQLYAWMRHWLSAYAHKEWPQVFALIPSSFKVGHPLPAVQMVAEGNGLYGVERNGAKVVTGESYQVASNICEARPRAIPDEADEVRQTILFPRESGAHQVQ